jgi:hypothetical protein
MALVVGTDSYVTLAEANAYWAARDNSTWSSASDSAKEKALREAAQYIDGEYTFIGYMYDLSQSMAWPRAGVYVTSGNFAGRNIDATTIPTQVKSAACELALEALSARLDPTTTDVIRKVKVDIIEVDYADFSPSQKSYSFVSKLLNGLTIGVSGTGLTQSKLARV